MSDILCPHCGEDIDEFVKGQASELITSGYFNDEITEAAQELARDYAESAQEAYD